MRERDSNLELGSTCYSTSLLHIHVYMKNRIKVQRYWLPEPFCEKPKIVLFAQHLTAFGSRVDMCSPLSDILPFIGSF